MSIKLPSRAPSGTPVAVETPCRIVVIGANGSGKTRFGIWLEQANQASMIVHRLSAQKALNLPDSAPMKTLKDAESDLLYGRHDQHASTARKVHDRWGNSPATFLLSDYEHLLAMLFAKDAERDRLHTHATRERQQYITVPNSVIDDIVKVWGTLMPHRTISFVDGRVLVGRGSPQEYHAKEMSDGERVALYLLGQCLSAPPGSMLVIDEPELHLHRSLMDKLWNTVEKECPGKSLVYITHDLDFAASRSDAAKIWIQSFDGQAWTWVDVPHDDALPEPLLLELIGNRKPTLFCEGERGGLDHTVYQLCLPHLHVLPRGGADRVIESTKSLRHNAALHTLHVAGLVDRDVLTSAEIAALWEQGVSVLAFAEVENLLCTEVVVRTVASQLKHDPAKVAADVTAFVASALKGELEAQVAIRAARRIRHHLSQYSAPRNEPGSLQQGVTDLVASLDVGAIATEERAVLAAALATGKLDTILGVYNRKSLLDQLSSLVGLKTREYGALVVRLLKSADGASLRDGLKKQLPRLSVPSA